MSEGRHRTVYVRLLDEGVDVWRPVEALALPEGGYQLQPTEDYDPARERWEFLPGSTVRCERRLLSDGPAFVAVSES